MYNSQDVIMVFVLPIEPLRVGRPSWVEPRSRRLFPLKQDERRLFVDTIDYQARLRRFFTATRLKVPSPKGDPLEGLDEQVNHWFARCQLEFRKTSNAIMGQAEEFLNHIYRFSYARGEVPDENILLNMLLAVIRGYLQKFCYRQSWDEMSEDTYKVFEDQASDLADMLTSRIKWPNHPHLWSSSK